MEAAARGTRILIPLAPKSRLARNSIFNLVGQGVPFLVALGAIPLLIQGLGTDRFGVLTLAWMVIGYFSFFDFGLGRALTQVVAERVSEGGDAVAPALAWAALALMLALGLAGTVVVSLIAPWLVHAGLKIPGPLQAETLHAFYMLAAGIPIVVVTAGLVGILSAFQRFGVLNLIRAPMGVYTFVAPLAVLPFSHSLLWVTTVLVVGRLLACAAYLLACKAVMPPLPRGVVQQFKTIRPLFRVGAWMTVTNVIGPLMVYLDRFVIGATVSVAAVAYYATPYEMVTKLWIVPGAVLGVLFPAFAASYRLDQVRLLQLYVRGIKYITLALFPVTLLIVGFAHEGLEWWLGTEFARFGTPVLQALAIGVFMNSLAQVMFTLIQGIGRPDLTAKLHLVELPVYLPVLWWAVNHLGIVGAAIVWTGRVAVDGSLLFWLSVRLLDDATGILKRLAVSVMFALGVLIVPLLVSDLISRIAVVSLIMALSTCLAWFVVLAEDERASLFGWIGRQ